MLIQDYKEMKPEKQGLYIGFRTFTDHSGIPERHVMSLWNLSGYLINFDLTAECGLWQKKQNNMLKAWQGVALQTFNHHQVSDKPGFSGTIRWFSTEKAGSIHAVQFRIKPKNFVKQAHAALTHRREWFELVLAAEAEEPSSSGSLKLNVVKKATEPNLLYRPDPQNKAAFPTSIDLHIEKLTPFYDKLAPGDMLKLQMSVFEKYLEEAIVHAVSPVYIVHGHGKGRLRDEVHKVLKRTKAVRSFDNAYDPVYGFGATRVWF